MHSTQRATPKTDIQCREILHVIPNAKRPVVPILGVDKNVFILMIIRNYP